MNQNFHIFCRVLKCRAYFDKIKEHKPKPLPNELTLSNKGVLVIYCRYDALKNWPYFKDIG